MEESKKLEMLAMDYVGDCDMMNCVENVIAVFGKNHSNVCADIGLI